jgi:hypothetical protein
MSFRADLRKLTQSSLPELVLLAQTFFWLGATRIAIAAFPFQNVAHWVGLKIGETAAPILETQVSDINRIAWAVNAAARRTPWDSACLAQSLTGAILLQRKNIPALLYLGVAKDGANKNFSAHAWLRCGEIILTGAGGHERFHVIATFTIGG